jgi:drug/metabolite transporter (DMT)-like permease
MPDPKPARAARTVIYTGLALIAFASNSILCRLALGEGAIDAGSFTAARLASGAVLLLAIRGAAGTRAVLSNRSGWVSAAMLFSYATAFSFAYLRLGAGTGALVLFGAVQATMILGALRSGERFVPLEGIGLGLAVAGLIYLVSPGLTAPSPLGCALMTVAGVSWGVYTLRGRGTGDPLGETARNFSRSLLFAVGIGLLAIRGLHLTARGFLLAALSGSLASGVGYVLWYAALRNLTAMRAAAVQLSVPVLAALGGVLFLSEAVSFRLLVAAILVLGGVGLAIAGQGRAAAGRAA